jgi:hypothetical protein
MNATTWQSLISSLFGTPEPILRFLGEVNWYALAIALLGPLLILFARQEIRLKRLKAIHDFLTTFNLPGIERTTLSTAPRSGVMDDGAQLSNGRSLEELPYAPQATDHLANPSFEYVKSKYISDLRLSAKRHDPLRLHRAKTDLERLNIYIEIACRPFQSINVRLYLASLSFIIVSYYGFKAFFTGLGYGSQVECAVATGCNLTLSETIGAFAFIGAYVAALRMLLRGLAIFDLSAVTFLRQSGEIVATVLVVVLLYNAFPTISSPLPGQLAQNIVGAPENEYDVGNRLSSRDTPAAATSNAQPMTAPAPITVANEDTSRVPGIWLALAVVLGLLPQSATKFIFLKMQTFVPWSKTMDDRFVEVTRVVALDIIDGIDFETRFRLEECGIYDVQNLAAYNPIMLFIETPYGFFQCIDWVAQAQLCHILGAEKFLTFRELNIRTIFDLERAIESIESPDSFDAMCATILLSPTQNLRRIGAISGFKFLVTKDGVVESETIDQYFEWLNSRIAENNGTTIAIEHLMSWIGDDLHVRRLRRLWNEIATSLEPGSEYLKDSKRNPRNVMAPVVQFDGKTL